MYSLSAAGPVGCLLAILLARSGRRVRVLERRSDPRAEETERGRSINLALAARGLLALERAEVLALIRPDMVEMRGRRLHDLAGHGPLLHYGQHAGEVIHAISRSRLNVALIEAAAALPTIELCFGQRGIDIDPHSGSRCDGAMRPTAACIRLQPAWWSAPTEPAPRLRNALHERGLLQSTEDVLAHDYKELHIPAAGRGGWALEPHALHVWPRGGYMLIALPNPDGSFTATLFLPARGAPGLRYTGPASAGAGVLCRRVSRCAGTHPRF